MVKRVSLVLSLIVAASIAALAQTPHPAEGAYTIAATGSEIGTVNFTLKLVKKGDMWSGEIVDSPIPMTVKSVSVAADNKVTIVASTGDAEVTISEPLMVTNSRATGRLARLKEPGPEPGKRPSPRQLQQPVPQPHPQPNRTSGGT